MLAVCSISKAGHHFLCVLLCGFTTSVWPSTRCLSRTLAVGRTDEWWCQSKSGQEVELQGQNGLKVFERDVEASSVNWPAASGFSSWFGACQLMPWWNSVTWCPLPTHPLIPALLPCWQLERFHKKNKKCCGNITSTSLPPLLLHAPAFSSVTLLSLSHFPISPFECFSHSFSTSLEKNDIKKNAFKKLKLSLSLSSLNPAAAAQRAGWESAGRCTSR